MLGKALFKISNNEADRHGQEASRRGTEDLQENSYRMQKS